MNSDLERFVETCKLINFRNRDELIEGIKSGEIIFDTHKSDSDFSCSHFIGIYERREKHLRQFQTEHSERLRKDVLEILERMSKTPDAKVGCWIFKKEPNISFALFVNVNTQEIFGCTKGIDKRLTLENELEEIWGKAI
jgi:hypothetical protein